MRLSPTATLVAMVLCARSLTGCAQETNLPVVAAMDALNEGRYVDARAALSDLLVKGDTTGRVVTGFLESFRAVGDFEQGLDESDRLIRSANWRRDNEGTWSGPGENQRFVSHALYMRGRLLAERGRYDEAEATYREAARLQRNYWRNAIELSALLRETGRTREAVQIDAAIFSAYKQGYFRTAEQFAVAGRAAAFLEEFHDANAAFRTASQIEPRNTDVLYWWGELFREKYNTADAQQTLEEAVRINGQAHWLFVALGRSYNAYGQKEALARQALEANPQSTDAMSLLASIRLLDGDDADAEQLARRALEINPRSMYALAQLASVQYVRGDTAGYRATASRALQSNPSASRFFVEVADNLSLRFRYPDAIRVSREAVAHAPRDPVALATLGTNLMRSGDFEQARRYLNAAFERDEFNVFAGNTLRLLDEYEHFRTLESAHFKLLIHESEADVLGARMLETAESVYSEMSPRYGYEPSGKILLEAYNDADDFAVRIAGVPHLGLLGVCFGDVVALNTPRALAGDAYNWSRTLRHELAHTMAIGVANFRVPRWFTEGLSVYEEKRNRPDWSRELELELFAAMDRDKLHPLAAMDRGFTRPEFPGQVLLSYYHASKILEYLTNWYSFEVVVDVLRHLRAGLSITDALERATGETVAALDARLMEALNQERAVVSEKLGGLPDVFAPDNRDASVGGSGIDQSDALSSSLRRGRELLDAGRTQDAEAEYRRSLALFDRYVGPGNAYHALASIYRDSPDNNRLMAILERYLQVADHGHEESRELAELYLRSGRTEDAVRYLERSLEVDPYDRDTRARLSDVYQSLGRHADAVRERRAVLSLDPVDRAEALYQFANALYLNDDIPDAKRAVLQALEIAPGHRDAQRLLLACVDGMPGNVDM